MGYFNFWLSLFAKPFTELKFGLSTDLSQKVKWFRWAKDLGQIYGLSTDLDRVKVNFGLSPDFSVQLKVSLSEG